ncbi:MAG: S8 family serine peptidase, partial [Bacteroidota bacterium]
MSKTTFLIVSLLLPIFCLAQKLDHAQGEYIVQLHQEVQSIQPILRKFKQYRGRNTQIKVKRCLSETMNIWQLQFDFGRIHERQFLQTLRRDKSVVLVQYNHFLRPRRTPNDPDFIEQWQYVNDGSIGSADADLDAELAWDITTGGVTVNGDTIVIVALDDGVDLAHEDFGNNLWVNRGEIPDNGIDDDNNGYIDDVHGWNPGTNSGNVGEGGGHGTPVMGIMGAKGNNGIGVVGVNWDVKVMMVKTDFEADEATLIAGYGYPLELRAKYNETNGAEGAFVVATNASWGVDEGMPEDAPVWCNLYDQLGAVGILNAGATSNENVNVDVDGDLPTTCPSDYLIGVTNVNRAGEKEFFAGFGRENIDIGAFGETAYTLELGNRYAPFGGTSGATPHVTGAIGLLYAAPCNNFGEVVKSNPAAAALLVRQYILDGAKPNANLDTLVATGGQLNLFNSLNLLMSNCGPCPVPLAVEVENIIDVSATISWVSGEDETAATLRFRRAGVANWTTLENVNTPFALTDLMACTNYEFQLKSDCGDETSGFSQTYTFKTDGCCIPPENIQVTSTDNSLRVAWDALFAAKSYEIRFAPLGSGSFQTLATINNFIEINELTSCTDYEFQIRTVCDNLTTDFSPLQTRTTNGCGSCTDIAYCPSSGNFEDEWIARVRLNSLDNITESEGGYGDYTSVTTDLRVGTDYELTVEIGYQNFPFDENIQAWIDFNQDGLFDAETENIIDLEEDITAELTTNISVPTDAVPGLTRMRVAIKWREGNSPEKPQPCDEFDFGEVEDYCVNIISDGIFCGIPGNIRLLDTPVDSIAFLTWDVPVANGTEMFNFRYRIVGTTDWINQTTTTPNSVFLSGLEQCSSYEIQAQLICDSMITSEFSESFIFDAACDVAITEVPLDVNALTFFPNPTSAFLQAEISLATPSSLQFNLFNLAGKVVLNKALPMLPDGLHTLSFDLQQLPAGVYLFQ